MPQNPKWFHLMYLGYIKLLVDQRLVSNGTMPGFMMGSGDPRASSLGDSQAASAAKLIPAPQFEIPRNWGGGGEPEDKI